MLSLIAIPSLLMAYYYRFILSPRKNIVKDKADFWLMTVRVTKLAARNQRLDAPQEP